MAHTKLRRATEQINLLEAKFQQAVNENLLKVKQIEDSKLWQGLDSKVSSTKTLCDQLTETLQQLATQTERAEEDKKLFEEKFGNNSTALDEFNCLLRDLSAKLECAEQTIISGKQQMLQIKHEKEEMDQSYMERLCANDTTIKEKDSFIKELEGSIDEYKARLICIDSRLQCMEQELKLKDDVCISLKENLVSAESENNLELRNQGYSLEIATLCKDNKNLNDLLSSFVAKVTELDEKHASMSSQASRLPSSFERFQGMVQEEIMLIARSSRDKFEDLQNKYVELMSENNGLKIAIEELKSRIIELQKTQKIQEFLEKISKLESDNQKLVDQVQSVMDEKSNNAESLQGEIAKRDQQVDTLENQVNQLRTNLDEKEQLYSCSVEREKTLEEQKLQVEASLVATECQLIEAKKQYDLMLEGKQIELSKHLVDLSLKNDQAINDIRKKHELEKTEISQITNAEKQKTEKLIREMERETTLEEERLQVEESLAGTECQHIEAKKQYDLMLEDKQIELSKHLIELCLKNDKVINDIRKKYELEKIEITNAEKQKAEKLIREMENKCNKKILENKKDSESYLMHLKEEHGTTLTRIQQDNEHKESTLWEYHKEELQRRSQAENKLREVTHHEYDVLTINGRTTECRKTRSTVMFGETSNRRSLHTIADNDTSTKGKVPNFARIVLNRENLPASCHSIIRGVRRAQAWCRAHGTYVDLSAFLGEGVGVYTTPPGSTFHMIVEFEDRELTSYLHGRDFYLRGWTGGPFGTFEIQEESSSEKKSEDNNINYIADPSCKVLKLGFNYTRLCKAGGVATVRTGPEALMDYFEVIYRCNGTISGQLAEAYAGFAVNLAEPVRSKEVLNKIVNPSGIYLENILLGNDLAYWVRKYGHYSRLIRQSVNCLYDGEPLPIIRDRRDDSVIPLLEIMDRYTVILLGSDEEGKFKQIGNPVPQVLFPINSYAIDDDDDDEEEEEEEEEKNERLVKDEHNEVELPRRAEMAKYNFSAQFFGADEMSFVAPLRFRIASVGIRDCHPMLPAPWGMLTTARENNRIPFHMPMLSICRRTLRMLKVVHWRFL
ncbi:hypothetical protein QOZ80_4AG0316300 [Eleusine coracana subsp. coracana]|nr:hypothetical protein QOZ80_4AG0316300 [Eleusine coracana subsp. coracana]